MKACKYVIIDEISPVVFNAPISHRDLQPLGNITSAGYFVRDGAEIVIAGEPYTIDVKNGKHDREILERFFSEMVAP